MRRHKLKLTYCFLYLSARVRPMPLSMATTVSISAAFLASLVSSFSGWVLRFTVVSAEEDGLENSVNLLDSDTKKLTQVGKVSRHRSPHLLLLFINQRLFKPRRKQKTRTPGSRTDRTHENVNVPSYSRRR